MRECGLKSYIHHIRTFSDSVAPLAGVWIEIKSAGQFFTPYNVAPLAGVWIEILLCLFDNLSVWVAPLAGVWIEILINRISNYP